METIVNGVRIALTLLVEFMEIMNKVWLRELNPPIDTKEMNKTLFESDVSILQQGFYQVSHGGVLWRQVAFSNGAAVSISGKQVLRCVRRPKVNNTTLWLIPSDNPQIAVAVVFLITPT